MKANTYAETYEQTVESYLIPYFRDALLTKIKSGDIQVFFNIMSAKYSQSVLDKMRLCLYGIFDTAIDNDLCYKNPVTHLVTHLCRFLCVFIRLLFFDAKKEKPLNYHRKPLIIKGFIVWWEVVDSDHRS